MNRGTTNGGALLCSPVATSSSSIIPTPDLHRNRLTAELPGTQRVMQFWRVWGPDCNCGPHEVYSISVLWTVTGRSANEIRLHL